MSDSLLRRWALGTLLFTMVVIVWGGYVRASGSGAGCGAHWPVCKGEVIPRDPSVQTIVELTHRLTSGLSFLAVAAMAWIARRATSAGSEVRRWAGWALGFMVVEAVAGAALVKFEWVANNASANRAMAMSVHLLVTFGLLATMALTTWAAWSGPKAPRGQPPPMLWIALGLVSLVGVSGAIAALGDTLVQQAVVSPLVDTLIRLRIWHPVIAIAATVAVVSAAVTAWSMPPARRWTVALGVLLVAQLAAGLTNVALEAPIWMQLVHLFVADSLWVVLVLVARVSASVKGEPRMVGSPTAA